MDLGSSSDLDILSDTEISNSSNLLSVNKSDQDPHQFLLEQNVCWSPRIKKLPFPNFSQAWYKKEQRLYNKKRNLRRNMNPLIRDSDNSFFP